MPKTKGQGIVFGIIMSITMAYGMEVYNIAIKMGFNLSNGGFSNMTNIVFWEALKEAGYMWLFVFLFSNLFGNKVGAVLSSKMTNAEKDNPFYIMTMRQCCTVLVMCPTMSLVAAILFNVILAKQSIVNLPAIWVGTIIKNFPMALIWNLFFAAPFTRFLFGKLFRQKDGVSIK